MIVIIDNFDSFVHNLARYFREAGAPTKVIRNDEIDIDACIASTPAGVVISPGPNTPSKAGQSLDLIDALPASIPFLGVCLGHQCLVEAFGGRTARAAYPLHGEARLIRHHSEGLFANIEAPTPVGRYHSLISTIDPRSDLIETAWSEEGEVMAVAHADRNWFGVQFHPESLLTPSGRQLIDNFLGYCGRPQ